jgi:hypothetical protein
VGPGLLDALLLLLALLLLARCAGVVRVGIPGAEREATAQGGASQQPQGTTPGRGCRERTREGIEAVGVYD